MTKKFLSLLATVALSATAAFGQTPIPSSYFGMSINLPTSVTWPNFYFGMSRTWDAVDGGDGVSWKDIEPTSLGTSCSSYTWTHLDNILAKYQSYSIVPIYTFGIVPGWANGNGGDYAPPSDLGASGSTYFNQFVTCLVARYGNQLIYEEWNEPDGFWSGTTQQLQTMWQYAYPIIKAVPGTLVLSPAYTAVAGLPAMNTYLADGGGTYMDAYSFHCYPWASGATPPPEFLANLIAYNNYVALANGLSVSSYCTEFDGNPGYYETSYPTFTAVSYILGAPLGLTSLVWYQFDNTSYGYLEGTNQGLNTSGAAYRVITSWLLGSTWTSPPARQAGTNGVRNTTFTGATPGTPGTPPTNMNVYNPDSGHGISTEIVGTGTDSGSGLAYLDFRVFGTATAGAADYVDFEMEASNHIAASAGQQWTMTVDISATPNITNGCPTAVSGGSGYGSMPQFETDTSSGSGAGSNSDGTGQQAFLPSSSGLLLSQLTYSSTAVLTGGTTAYVRPALYFTYTTGRAIDCTYRLAAPSIDNGTVWVGNLTRSNGATSQIVWDSANGASGTVNYSTTYSYWRDIAGQLHPVVGGTVTLTNSPIILDSLP